MKYIKTIKACSFFLSFLLLIPTLCHSLEYQWKFIIHQIKDSQSSITVFELYHSLPGILDVDIQKERNAAVFTYDDEITDEEKIQQSLEQAGYRVTKTLLLEEPREGVMN